MMFIKLTVINDEETQITKAAALIALERVDSFRINEEGKLQVWYKEKDKNGSNWADTIDEKASDISYTLLKAGLLLKIESNEDKK